MWVHPPIAVPREVQCVPVFIALDDGRFAGPRVLGYEPATTASVKLEWAVVVDREFGAVVKLRKLTDGARLGR